MAPATTPTADATTPSLPVRKMLRRVDAWQKVRGAVICVMLAAMYTLINYILFDWSYANQAYRFIAEAESELPGVLVTESPYCKRADSGLMVDMSTGDPCLTPWAEVNQFAEIQDYLSSTFVQLPTGVREFCPLCTVAISGSKLPLPSQTPRDYVCTDFHVGYPQLGVKDDRCFDNGDGIPSKDIEWCGRSHRLPLLSAEA